MSRRKLWTRRVLLVGLLCLGLEQAWRHGRDYVFADRFATVEPGKLYRGAWQQPWPMRRLCASTTSRQSSLSLTPPMIRLPCGKRGLRRNSG